MGDKTIKEVMNDLSNLNGSIKRILADTMFDDYDDLSAMEIDNKDAEELYMQDELRSILYKLSDVSHSLEYLKRPVKNEGVLHKNINGRYEYNGVELTCGCSLEYLAKDSWHMIYDENDEYVMVPYWKYGRIEADEKGYYIVGADKNVELEGLHVRNR